MVHLLHNYAIVQDIVDWQDCVWQKQSEQAMLAVRMCDARRNQCAHLQGLQAQAKLSHKVFNETIAIGGIWLLNTQDVQPLHW